MSGNQKPYAESCKENAPPILEVLKQKLPQSGELLEIGSGTGQHAVLFARSFPTIIWHTSELTDMHSGIQMWLDEVQLSNLRPPVALDVLNDSWPIQKFDAIYTANTAHIMPKSAVEAMFRGAALKLKAGAPFLIYGPFMYNGKHTSVSNTRFEHWLRSQDQNRGIRDLIWLRDLACECGLYLDEDIEMPANNRMLIWRLI